MPSRRSSQPRKNAPLTGPDRRSFLSTLGVGAAALLSGCQSDPAPMPAPTPPTDRLALLNVLNRSPLNAEPPMSALTESWITPLDRFFINNHSEIPRLSSADHRLSVEGLVDRPLSLNLDEMRARFPRTEWVATLACAGNRRDEFSRIQAVGEVQWSGGTLGNARWSGFRLREVLQAAGLKDGAAFVSFHGLDRIEKNGRFQPFGASIPLQKALSLDDPLGGALLATQMNGQDLTPEHGAPLRMIVPG